MTRDQDILDYLQDRLTPEDRAAFETAMAGDTSLAAEVDILRSVRADLQSAPKHPDAEAVWDRISIGIDRETQPANVNQAPWKQVLKYAAVAVFAVAAWQIVGVPRTDGVPDGFRTASEDTIEFSVQVKFVEAATLTDIAALVLQFGGRISDGPSALGLVTLSFPDADAREQAITLLDADTALVEFVAQ